MIVDRLQSANSVILDSVNAANNKHAVESFKNQLAVLSVLTAQLEQLINLTEAMQDKGITSTIMTMEIKKSLYEAVNNCGEKTDDHSLEAGTVAALKNAIDLYRNALSAVWKESAYKECTPIIESLTSLKGLLGNAKEADSLIEYLKKVQTSTPASTSALDKYLANVEKGKKIIEELHFDSDPEVISFIKKKKKKKATINNLTPHIMEWLKANQLADKIKLRFS